MQPLSAMLTIRGQSQEDRAEVLGGGFQASHAKVRQAQSGFQVQVIDFPLPAAGIEFQYLLGRKRSIGRQEVRPVMILGVPFGEEDENLFAKAFEAAFFNANPIFRGRVRGAHSDGFQALVPYVAGVESQSLSFKDPVVLEGTDHMPLLAADKTDETFGGVPAVEQDVDPRSGGKLQG